MKLSPYIRTLAYSAACFVATITSAQTRPKVISFDCAQTLIKVDMDLAKLAINAAEEAGYKIADKEKATKEFNELFAANKEVQKALQDTHDSEKTKAHMGIWLKFIQAWTQKIGLPQGIAPLILMTAFKKVADPKSEIYSLFPETKATLEGLKKQGYILAVVSNWDTSLKKVLDHFELVPYFDLIVGSQEAKVAKPDPKIFQIVLNKFSVKPHEVIHVGDTHEDDIVGATAAGIRPILIDRNAKESNKQTIRSLSELLNYNTTG